jgi:hypothetical protein
VVGELWFVICGRETQEAFGRMTVLKYPARAPQEPAGMPVLLWAGD